MPILIPFRIAIFDFPATFTEVLTKKEIIGIISLYNIFLKAERNTKNEKNLEHTLKEAQDILACHLQEQKIDLSIGATDYYVYLLELLMHDGDETLISHPQYELILDYASVYLAEMQRLEAEHGEAPLSKLKPQEAKLLFSQTIEEVAEKSKINLSLESEIALTATPPSIPEVSYNYDATKAVAYAHKWAKARNSSYRSFSSDCTNFVSQCLRAGGVPPVGQIEIAYEMSKNQHSWYNAESHYTQSFVQVSPFAFFWISSKSVRIVTPKTYNTAVKSVKPGDVVNLIRPTTSVHYHSIIITKKSGNTAYYCGHTTDRKDEPFITTEKNNHYLIMKFSER